MAMITEYGRRKMEILDWSISMECIMEKDRNSSLFSLIVLHVRCCRVELEIALDDLVNSSQEVLLGCDLPTSTDGIHTSLRSYTA